MKSPDYTTLHANPSGGEISIRLSLSVKLAVNAPLAMTNKVS